MPKIPWECALGNTATKTIVAASNTDLATLDTNRVLITNPGGAPITIGAFGFDVNITMRVTIADPGITIAHNPPWIRTLSGANRVTAVGDVGVYTVGNSGGQFYEESWGNANAGDIAALQSQVAALQSQVGTLNSQMAALTPRVTALESWKSTVDAYMSAHP